MRRLLTLLMALIAAEAQATTLAVGAVVGGLSGLSIHVAPEPGVAYHFTGRYGDEQLAAALDYHRVMASPWSGGEAAASMSFYAGLGLSGRNDAEVEEGESYELRLPIGAQWNISPVHVQLFGEICGLLGKLPETSLASEARLGLRAYF